MLRGARELVDEARAKALVEEVGFAMVCYLIVVGMVWGGRVGLYVVDVGVPV